jgi:hypothetical protein
LVSPTWTFGKLALEPVDCWTPAEVKELHRQFHKIDESIVQYYSNAVEILRILPARQEQLRSIYPKVWGLLRSWGRVQGLTREDSRNLVKALNSYGGLLQLLRDYSLNDDLDKAIRFGGENRTLANWMQMFLGLVSHQRRNELVASTKLLHAAVPKLFPMFDNAMSYRFFGVNPSVAVYCGLFLPLAQSQIHLLRSYNIEPAENRVCAGSWAKLIDEINWTWANP